MCGNSPYSAYSPPTMFGFEFRLYKHFSHPQPPQLRIFIPFTFILWILHILLYIFLGGKKSWWGKTELYRQSLTSPFHIKCCTIFCRQLSRIFLPVPKWTRLGRWYILENVVCFRFSCSSRGDNVHSLHQLSLRSYDGRTLCDMQKRALHCVPLFKTLVIILRLKTNPFDVFNNDLTSKHVFEQSSVEVDTFLHLTHHHDHHLTRA